MNVSGPDIAILAAAAESTGLDLSIPEIAILVVAGLALVLVIVLLVRTGRILVEVRELGNAVDANRKDLPSEVAAKLPDPAADLAAMAERLEGLAGEPDKAAARIGEIETKLDALGAKLAEVAGREPPPPPDVGKEVEAVVAPLVAKLREELGADLGGKLEALAPPEPEPQPEPEPEPEPEDEPEAGPAAEDLEAAVARSLGERGFREVAVVEGPTPVEGDREKLVVEARRDGMTYKGVVIVSAGRVVEQRLSSSHTMFP
jgi:hypothetical protein